MAEYGGFVDGTGYTAAEYAQLVVADGKNIAKDYEEELEVSVGTGLQVLVGSGIVSDRGRYYLQTESATGGTPKTLAIDAATTGFLRKDRVVVEFNITAETFLVKVSKGTETAANPVAPALVDTSTIWEFPLAIVNIDGNTIDSIEDGRVIGSREVHGYTASKVMVSDSDGTLQASTADSADLANISDIATNTANIATNTSDIATNTSNIATNTSNIATNTANIATNTSDISDLKGKEFCHVVRTSDQTSGNDILWTYEVSDDFGMHYTNGKYVVFGHSAVYDIDCIVSISNSSTTGSPLMSIIHEDSSGTKINEYRVAVRIPTAGDFSFIIPVSIKVTATDRIRVVSSNTLSSTYKAQGYSTFYETSLSVTEQ